MSAVGALGSVLICRADSWCVACTPDRYVLFVLPALRRSADRGLEIPTDYLAGWLAGWLACSDLM